MTGAAFGRLDFLYSEREKGDRKYRLSSQKDPPLSEQKGKRCHRKKFACCLYIKEED